DSATGQQKNSFGDGKYPVACLAVNPHTGTVLAGQGVTVRAWDAGTGKELFRLTGHNDAVRCLACSADGRRLVTGSDDRTVRLWDGQTGKELRRFSGHRQMVNALACTADGQVLSASNDQTVRLWDAASGAELSTGQGHTAAVTAVALQPKGDLAVSASMDQ